MQLYAGIDLHSNNLVLVSVDETGRHLLKQKLANDRGPGVSKLLRPEGRPPAPGPPNQPADPRL